MDILIFIIGIIFGVITMSIFQINKINEIEQDKTNNFIHKNKIYKKIRELDEYKELTLDVKVHSLYDTYQFAKEQLEKLL